MFILGKNIETVYKKWGMTQKKFAEFIGIVPNTLNNYMHNTRPAKLDFLQKVSNASGFDINTLQTRLLSPYEVTDKPIKEGEQKSTVSEPKLTYEYDLRAELLLQKETITRLEQQIGEMRKEIDLLKGKK